MGDKKFSMDDYVDVAERIQDFLDTHPSGSLGVTGHGVYTVGGKDFVWCSVTAMRTPDDVAPGVGLAWEPVPGLTNFTKNSEMQNAHTAAMGRAVIALGLIANRKMASRQEVRNRMVEQQEATGTAAAAVPGVPVAKPKPARVPKVTAEERTALVTLYVEAGWDQATLCLQLVLIDALDGAAAEALGTNPTDEQYAALVGPAMGSLSAAQYKTVMESLQVAVDQKNAKAAA